MKAILSALPLFLKDDQRFDKIADLIGKSDFLTLPLFRKIHQPVQFPEALLFLVELAVDAETRKHIDEKIVFLQCEEDVAAFAAGENLVHFLGETEVEVRESSRNRYEGRCGCSIGDETPWLPNT